ncbi:MAG: Hpt domain-containing protein, partial [Bacillota bacterium]|nr:Hpt domain-containing protein [Bacillota bacterium]
MERFVDNPDFLQDIFLEESWKNVDRIDGFIESKANQEKFEITAEEVNSLYRTMHSIKGSAAMMGYPVISETAHAAEDLFSYLREEASPAQKDLQQILQ